jgi:hypothetical protein
MKLKNFMAGWGKTRETKPLRNTLAGRSVAVMSANQIRRILNFDPVIPNQIRRELEHRAGFIRDLDQYMKNYYRRKARNVNRRKMNGPKNKNKK